MVSRKFKVLSVLHMGRHVVATMRREWSHKMRTCVFGAGEMFVRPEQIFRGDVSGDADLLPAPRLWQRMLAAFVQQVP